MENIKKKKTKKKVVVKKKVTNKKQGRPTKFSADKVELMRYMYETGATDRAVAARLKVDPQTLYNWRAAHPSFFESLKDWKGLVDRDVEASLFERARGYTTTEIKTFMTRTGEIVTKEVLKHYPPDPTSMIFWLKNRKTKEWRDKVTLDVGSDKNFSFGFSIDEKPSKVDESLDDNDNE